MTLKIGIGLAFYNDFDSLRRMLQSCQEYPIDMIIAVDGKYDTYPATKPLSDKQTKDLFKGFQTPYKLFDAPNLSQNAKRQIYFDKSEEFGLDIIIVMDTDEYFIASKTNWPLFMDDLRQKIADHAHTWVQCYCLPTYLTDKGVEKMPKDYFENLPRIFYQPWKLTYVEDHYTIRNKNTGVLQTTQSSQVLSHIALGHDHNLRSEKYKQQTAQYEDELMAYEDAHKQQWRDEFSEKLYKQNHSS